MSWQLTGLDTGSRRPEGKADGARDWPIEGMCRLGRCPHCTLPEIATRLLSGSVAPRMSLSRYQVALFQRSACPSTPQLPDEILA